MIIESVKEAKTHFSNLVEKPSALSSTKQKVIFGLCEGMGKIDRMMIAQAITEDFHFMTVDKKNKIYSVKLV